MAVKILNGIDLNNQRATNAADPSSATDLSTKQYVDNVAAGRNWKQFVDAATVANAALTTAYENGDVVDGVTLTTGMRILIKDQTTGSENGIYTVNASGSPTRATDADSTGDLTPGTSVYVAQGTVNGDKIFSITSPNSAITIGTTATTWGQTGGSGSGGFSTAGSGLTSSGATVNVVGGTGIVANADDVAIDPAVVVRKFAANIGDGSTTAITVTHNLGTRDVVVSIHDATTFERVYPDIAHTTVNTVTVTFATAPASAAYRAVVHG
jgi:hypothetical protein